MKRQLSIFLVILVSLLFVVSLVNATAKEKKTTWKMSTFIPKSDCDWYVTLTRVKGLIEEASNGKIEVKLFPVGTLVDPDSLVDAVLSGAIQGAQILPGMAAHRVPSALGTEMPYGAKDLYEHHEVHTKWGLFDIMQKEYAANNLHLLYFGTSGQISFLSTFPVKKTSDLKGKKIWTIPNVNFLGKFGASIVEVPGMDMYSAVKLGTIDGFAWTMGELEFGNFKEVVKYVMQPRLATPGVHIIVNKRAWDKLGTELQKKIQNHLLANRVEVAKEYETYDEKSIKASKEYGVQFIEMPKAEVDKFKTAATEFWVEVEGLSPASGEMIKKYKAFLKSKGR
ncbi:MAG: TRAP transporter substrate-binding protein [Planctomycetota bacterium]